jgi:acetyl esterase/lipase
MAETLFRRLTKAFGRLMEGLSPLSLINKVIPRSGYLEHRGMGYGSQERQKLDLYVPLSPTPNPPVVVFFYGGSWQRGRRKDYLFVAQALTGRGVVTVIPDYRVYSEAKFPTFIEDGASAVSWVRNHIGNFGVDPSSLFLMGHSAGAYIAAMLALNPHYLAQVGLSASELRGLIGLAGPYDFLPLKSPRLIDIFGGADSIPETQPVNFVSASSPPALLLHGAKDKTVRVRNTERLAERLRRLRCPVVEKIYPSYRHIMILLVLASPFQDGEPVMNDIASFIWANR